MRPAPTQQPHRPAVRAAGEEGYVILFVLAVVTIVLAMGVAGLAGALSANSLTNHDTRVRRAQQAADAGVQAQLYQQSEADLGSSSYNLNGGLLGTGITVDCIVPNLSLSLVTSLVSAYVSGNNACPQAESGGGSTSYTGALGNHSFEQSEFFPNEVNAGNGSEREMFPEIVSLGKDTTPIPAGSGTVYAREKVLLAPVAPLQAIEGMGNVTLNGLSVLGINLLATVNGDISTTGTLNLPTLTVGTNLLSSSIFPTFSASQFCTNGLLGACPGLHIATASYNTVPTTPCSAGTPSSTCVVQRTPVIISSSKPDCANSSGVAVTCTNSLFGCASCYSSTGTTADTFSMSSGTATFPPGDYVFCNFNVTGGTISTTSSTSPVRIFIDSPSSSRCSGDTSVGNFAALTGIDNLLEPASPLGTTTAPSSLQIYVAGNGTANGTTVQLGPTSESLSLAAVYGAIIYAPMSNVTVNVPAACILTVCTGGVFDGSVIGDNVTMSALLVTEDLDINNLPLYAGVNAFRPVEEIQCDGSVTSLSGNETTDTGGC